MDSVGYAIRTTDGVVGTSGTPKEIYGFTFLSGGGGVGTVAVHDGTGTSGPLVFTLTGTASQATTIPICELGVRFINGCYLNIDANITSVTTMYKEVR